MDIKSSLTPNAAGLAEELEQALKYAHACVLVVDDQPSIANVIERTIGLRLGCQTMTAPDGDTALELMSGNAFDVLVTDMMMPGTHGLELISKARAQAPHMAIIVMTGYRDEFPYVEVIKAGARDFINKPFLPLELEAKLIRIFEEQALHREMRAAESKYRSLFDSSIEGILLLETEQKAIVDANRSFQELSGRDYESLIGASILSLFSNLDRARIEQWFAICARNGRGVLSDLELLTASGETTTVDISLAFIQSEYESFVFLTFRDVTEKREVETQLAEAAEKDELTGLYNKRSFLQRIESASRRALSLHEPLSLLMIDLDHFKQCNDTHGHQIGDKLLQEVGAAIRKSIRGSTTDAGFRYGGDEFAVLLTETDAKGCVPVAERIRGNFAAIESYGTTMSIGAAQYDASRSTSDLIRAADEALYKAKGAGRNRIAVSGE